MEILKIVIPKWNIAEITGYDPMTTFWQDFSMADKFGNEAIADTYRKVKAEWKDNYKHWTELCLVLNHKFGNGTSGTTRKPRSMTAEWPDELQEYYFQITD